MAWDPVQQQTGGATRSADNTVISLPGQFIVDAAGNRWSIVNGQVAVNGVPDMATAHVIEMAYEGGLVWQETAADLWWSKTTPSGQWLPRYGTATVPIPNWQASASGTVVTAAGGNATASIKDRSGNTWSIAGGKITLNRVADPTTANVIELAYVNGSVWQENANQFWWSKGKPTDPWSPTSAPAGLPKPPPSPDGTVATGVGAAITDASGNLWTINTGGRIVVNGTVDGTTANVDELAYYRGVVWQKNAGNQWYSKTSPAATWVHWTGATPPVPIIGVSANGAMIDAGTAGTLVDANGNVWGLTRASASKGYQVTVDGAVDQTTVNVTRMQIFNGIVWQENTAGLWYSKTTPASAWSAGTADPAPISLTWVGGGDNLASNPAHWLPDVAPRPGDSLTMGSGTMSLTGKALAGDRLTITPTSTANINTGAAATLNLSVQRATANIDIAAGTTLSLNANAAFSYLNIHGEGTLSLNGTNAISAFRTVVSNDIVGIATVDLFGGNAAGEFMRVEGSAANGLTFDINSPGPCDAGLQIDHPLAFHGSIVLHSGFAALMGLHATSGTLSNGVLDVYNGSNLVDVVKLTGVQNSGGHGLEMQQNSQGVMLSIGIGDDYQPGGIGAVLPLHT